MRIQPAALVACVILALGFEAVLAAPPQTTYSVTQVFKIGGAGGWDYLTVDSQHKLLYVPRSTHTQVIDEATGKVTADMPGQTGNHGVALVPEVGRGFITDGRGAAVFVFDAKSHEILGKLKAVMDSDGMIYDPASKQVLFVSGDGGVVIPIAPNVDPKSGEVGQAVDLGGKPEFLASDGQGRVFINLVDKNQVVVLDSKAMKVLEKWPVAPGGSPVGMAIDAAHYHLFIGCRNPQKLVIMSTDDGKVLGDLPIGKGVDAVQCDEGNVFASCADGTLAVARETSPAKWEIIQTAKTPIGARTMGLDATTHALYLPTAEMQEAGTATTQPTRPTPKPDTFMVVEVQRGSK
jgi:DNA-binding beta-propeller fold protein YncE